MKTISKKDMEILLLLRGYLEKNPKDFMIPKFLESLEPAISVTLNPERVGLFLRHYHLIGSKVRTSAGYMFEIDDVQLSEILLSLSDLPSAKAPSFSLVDTVFPEDPPWLSVLQEPMPKDLDKPKIANHWFETYFSISDGSDANECYGKTLMAIRAFDLLKAKNSASVMPFIVTGISEKRITTILSEIAMQGWIGLDAEGNLHLTAKARARTPEGSV